MPATSPSVSTVAAPFTTAPSPEQATPTPAQAAAERSLALQRAQELAEWRHDMRATFN